MLIISIIFLIPIFVKAEYGNCNTYNNELECELRPCVWDPPFSRCLEKCVDTDGKNYFSEGTVDVIKEITPEGETILEGHSTDSCGYNSNGQIKILGEVFCGSSNQKEVEDYECQNGCKDNACIETPSCDDGLKNGNEIAVDCGGSCQECDCQPDCTKKSDNKCHKECTNIIEECLSVSEDAEGKELNTVVDISDSCRGFYDLDNDGTPHMTWIDYNNDIIFNYGKAIFPECYLKDLTEGYNFNYIECTDTNCPEQCKSALTGITGCCERTKQGLYCKSSVDSSKCESGFHENTDCFDIADCEQGCCEGKLQCMDFKYKLECIDQNGLYDSSSCNELPYCGGGCCKLLEKDCVSGFRKHCEGVGGTFIPYIFDPEECEAQCKLAETIAQNKCIDETPFGQCSITQPEYCDAQGSLFNDCSKCGCPSLDYICKPDGRCATTVEQNGIMCVKHECGTLGSSPCLNDIWPIVKLPAESEEDACKKLGNNWGNIKLPEDLIGSTQVEAALIAVAVAGCKTSGVCVYCVKLEDKGCQVNPKCEGIPNTNENARIAKTYLCPDIEITVGGTCSNLINNGNSQDKIDVVLIGDGYESTSEVRSDAMKLIDYDGNNGFLGLFSYEPFKSNKEKFNVWMMNVFNNIEYENDRPKRSSALDIASTCTQADYQIFISKAHYRSFAFLNTDAYNSVGDSITWEEGKKFTHEFGHSFGKLVDEYLEGNKEDKPTKPNCAPNKATAEAWWGDLYEPGRIGYFQGCHYVINNIRPTFNSIMRSHDLSKDTSFEAVNERHINSLLENYK